MRFGDLHTVNVVYPLSPSRYDMHLGMLSEGEQYFGCENATYYFNKVIKVHTSARLVRVGVFEIPPTVYSIAH